MAKLRRSKVDFNLKKFVAGYDKSTILILIVLAIFGLLAVYNSSVVLAARDFGDQFRFVHDQAMFFIIGFIVMIIVSWIDYHIWYRLAIPLLFITLVLLIAVFIPGLGIKALGAKRWINFGVFILQPTEFAKLSLVVYLSAWFAQKEKSRFLAFLLLLGIVVGLIVLQPDLGTAIIISSLAAVLYFISGASWLHFLIIIPMLLVATGIFALTAPYRWSRISTFLNPNIDPLGTSYHIRQILIALGSGGLFGLGFGKSRQKYEYLPEANTDSIFAIIAEEVGFMGSVVLIFVMAFLVYRAFDIARKAPDRFGKLLASGVGSWFAIQTLINLSSMVALIPLTGAPLPLISYGGSNLISLLIGFGILLNIGKQSVLTRSTKK